MTILIASLVQPESHPVAANSLTLVVSEVEKEFRDEAVSGCPAAPQPLQVALTQIAGIDGVLQGAVLLLLLLLAGIEAVAICCRDGHSCCVAM
jgi:hypothetical protein